MSAILFNDELLAHSLVHSEERLIRGYDVDVTRRASVPSLIQIMHDTAIQQIITLGVSALELQPLDLGWVLTNQQLWIYDRPLLGDTVTLLTHPSGMDRFLTYRDYYLLSSDQKILAKATTTWILMNIKERKIAPFPAFIRTLLERSTELPHLERARQRKWKLATPDHTIERTAGYSDLDFNHHVSNHYFFKWMLDALPRDFLAARTLSSFNVKLKGELFCDDQVTAEVKVNESEVLHQLRKGEEVIATGESLWS